MVGVSLFDTANEKSFYICAHSLVFQNFATCEVNKKLKMFKKKIRGDKVLQSGRKVGLGVGGSRNAKRSQDLRSTLAQKGVKKGQVGRALTAKSKASSLVDARRKISSKKNQGKPLVRSISLLDERRKEQRQNLHQQNRSLTLSTGGQIQITTKQEVPPDRSATMMGDSIRITAKVERSKEDLEREANIIAGYLKIKAKNEAAKRKERENEAKKRERQNEARRRERERNAKTREKEKRGHALYSQMAGENDSIATNNTELDTGDGLKDSVSEGKLDHSLKSNRSQTEKGPISSKQEAPSSCRITVSNLHPLVTQQDVQELFGVVGELRSCKVLGRGTAEVVYVKKEDALFAFSRYHNRKLDGQPMQCKLITLPSASLYSPPPARLPPLPPLRATPAAPSRPPPRSLPAEREQGQTTQSSRPVVFKVRI